MGSAALRHDTAAVLLTLLSQITASLTSQLVTASNSEAVKH